MLRTRLEQRSVYQNTYPVKNQNMYGYLELHDTEQSSAAEQDDYDAYPLKRKNSRN
jgi:hypothetical protein